MKKSIIFFLTYACPIWIAVTFAQQDNAIDTTRVSFNRLVDSSEIYYTSGNYKKSLEVNIKILNKAFEIGDPSLIHKGYRFLGYDFMALDDMVTAQENFVKSERYAIESKNDTAIAITYMDLANLYSYEEEGYDKAMKYHKKSIEKFKKIKDSLSLSKAYFNTVVTAFSEEKYKSGLYYLNKANELRKQAKSISFEAGIENLFGSYYISQNQFEKAEEAYLKAIEIGEKEELSAELENSYRGYSDVLFEKEEYVKAFEIRKIYEEYLLANSEIVKSAAANNVSSKFQIAEYQKSAEAAQQKNELQAELMETKNRTNTFLWFFSALGVVLTGYLFYAYRRRKRLVRELQIKNKEYLRAKEESDKLAKAKAEFFSTVSHELRTPLYGVIGLSTILLENKELEKHEEDLKSLKFSADYLLALINDVLQMNKIDSQSFDEDDAVFNLRELIGTIASSFEYMKLQHNNIFEITIEPQMPELLKGNSVRLSQILMNLIGNACKFTENGIIDINARVTNATEEDVMVQFTVKDTGMGIAKNKLESIFNEFSQIEAASQNYQGTGLGLPIVKKLLQQANSEINVLSEPGIGSTFTFTLLFDVLRKNNTQDTAPIIDTKQLASKRILIVEDNRINQTVTKKILENDGVLCEIAENGEEAIECVENETYDLVLMDINMPVKNGIEATQEIRKFNKNIPIIALTAVEVEEIRYRIFDCGMNDIIVKPYDVTKFRETIAKNLMTKDTSLKKSKTV
ncbi:response regulator [Rasiella rasia]|uniref:histidine kinase n=1 Tax=Rasiella rasia TaxID=2744027 RepID=A0A6G6GM83_9FLAO|nr:response regulator [Rasiella rasia]QIE59600.1 response regulator [Rasiella rasia]